MNTYFPHQFPYQVPCVSRFSTSSLTVCLPFSVFATGVSAWCDKCPLLFVAWPDSTDRRELGFYSLSLSRTPSSVVAT